MTSRQSLCPLALPFPSLGLLGAARYPSVHRCLKKRMNFSSCSVSKDGKCWGNSPCSFSGPVGELGTMNRVLGKLFWLGATKSIELLERNTGNGCYLHTCNRASSKTTAMGLTGTNSPAPVFPVLTDAAVAGSGQELEEAAPPAPAQKQCCLPQCLKENGVRNVLVSGNHHQTVTFPLPVLSASNRSC